MQGNNLQRKPSLLRVFLLSMVVIGLLFSFMTLGIWLSTTSVLNREKRLINELLPELDAAHQLTSATAGLRSQGYLLRSSQSVPELKRRHNTMVLTVADISRTLDTMSNVASEKLDNIRQSVADAQGVAISLAQVRTQQLRLARQIEKEMPERVEVLNDLEKQVDLRIVALTELLLEVSQKISELDTENPIDAVEGDLFEQQILEYEALSLSIQDHLLFNQDVVALNSTVVKVPLLDDEQSITLTLQSRDLIVSALASRSIYMADTEHGGLLLTLLRQLRGKMEGKKSLFDMQKNVVTYEQSQDTLHEVLQQHTEEILEQTTAIRNESRTIVNTLAQETLSGLDRSRALPIVLSLIALLLLGMVSYWLLYRRTVMPLMSITRQLDDVGTDRFPDVAKDYYLKELSALSQAMMQLDEAQTSMVVQDQKLQAINSDLKRANEELKQFAHVASHDLQEPLRKLQQFSELLVEDYGDKLDGDALFFVETISRSAERMSALIKETLAYSSARSSNQKLIHLDLADLLNQLFDEMEMATREADGQLIIDEMPVVLANELGVAQLFRNLMINGLKYRKHGTPARIRISADHSAGSTVTIRVEDNGIGIPAEYLDKIFIPFERLHSSDAPGTGLGLSICKKVCEVHGWTLEVNSTPDVGTVFAINIPVSSVKYD